MKISKITISASLLIVAFLVNTTIITHAGSESVQKISYGITLNMPTKIQSEANLLPIVKQNLDAALHTGAKTVRVAIPWSHIHPKKPKDIKEGNWYIPEMWIKEARVRNLEVLLRIDAVKYRDCNTSGVWMGWKYGCPENGLLPNESDPRIKQAGLPKDEEAWTKFVTEFARRFGTDVRYYQVGNEVDSESFWAGTADEYIKLLSLTKRALYKVSPDLKLMSAGMTSGIVAQRSEVESGTACSKMSATDCATLKNRISFIDRVLKQGVTTLQESKSEPSRYGFDLADVHVYGTVYETDDIVNEWQAWLAESAKINNISGGKIPFWITETGGPQETTQSLAGGCSTVSETEGYKNRHFRQIVHRAVSFAKYAPERVFWWSIIDYPNSDNIAFSCMGLYTNSWSPKAGLFDYQFFAMEADAAAGISEISDTPSNVSIFRMKMRSVFTEEGNTDVIVIYAKDPNIAMNKVKILFPQNSSPKRILPGGFRPNVDVVKDGNYITPGFVPAIFIAPAETTMSK